MTQCPSLFSIPELAYEVAKHLDTADLAAVVRVSKVFFNLFIPCLWRTMVIEQQGPTTTTTAAAGSGGGGGSLNQSQKHQKHHHQPQLMFALGPFQEALARYGHQHITTLWINMSSPWLVKSGLAQHCRRLGELTLQLDQTVTSAEEEEMEMEMDDDDDDDDEENESNSISDNNHGNDHSHNTTNVVEDEENEAVFNRETERTANRRSMRCFERERDKRMAVDAMLRHNHKTLTYISLMSLHLPVRARSFVAMDRLRHLNLSFVSLEVREFFAILDQAPMLEKLSCRFSSFYLANNKGREGSNHEADGGEENDEEEDDLRPPIFYHQGNDGHGGLDPASDQDPSQWLDLSTTVTPTTTMTTVEEERNQLRQSLRSLSFIVGGHLPDAFVLRQLLRRYNQLTELEVMLLEVTPMEMISHTLERTCPDLQTLSVTACLTARPGLEVAAQQLTEACRHKRELKSLEIGAYRNPWSPCLTRFEYLAPQLEQLQLYGVGRLPGEEDAHDDNNDIADGGGEHGAILGTEGGLGDEEDEEDAHLFQLLDEDLAISQHGRPWIRMLLQECTRLRSLQIYAQRGRDAGFVLEHMAAIDQWHCQGLEELAVVFPTFMVDHDDEEEDDIEDDDDDGGDDGGEDEDDDIHMDREDEDENGRIRREGGSEQDNSYQQHQQIQEPTPPPSSMAGRRVAVELRFLRKVRTNLPRLRHLCLQEYDSRHPGARLRRVLQELYPLRGSLVLLSIPRSRTNYNRADEGLMTWLDVHWPELTIQGVRFYSHSAMAMEGVKEGASGSGVPSSSGKLHHALPPRPGEGVSPAACWGVDWRGGEYA
ncbi:hypothetical protein DFQ26_002938 [Actinomortierella ambigua]|nr:hypothetical protein DFQ26_002938 [Actinomortierella ambigua]